MRTTLGHLCLGLIICIAVTGCGQRVETYQVPKPSASDSNATWATRVEPVLRNATSYWIVDLVGELDAKPPLRQVYDGAKPAQTPPEGYIVAGKQLIRSDHATRSTAPLPCDEILALIKTYDPKCEPPPCDCLAEPELLLILLDASDTLIGTISLDNHGYLRIEDAAVSWSWEWYGIPDSLAKIVAKNNEIYREREL
jgi:hypothetical protein